MQYLIDSAVLVIVPTTNPIVKFDSSAFFKKVPRLETFSGYGPDGSIGKQKVLNRKPKDV